VGPIAFERGRIVVSAYWIS